MTATSTGFSPNESADAVSGHRAFRRVFSGAIWSFGWRIIGLAAGYAFTLLIARRTGARGTGLFTWGLTATQIGAVIAALGMDVGVLRFLGEARVRDWNASAVMRKIAVIALLSSAALGAALVLSADPLARYVIRDFSVAGPLRLAGFSLPAATLLVVVSEAFRGVGAPAWYSALRNFATFGLAIAAYFVIPNAVGAGSMVAYSAALFAAAGAAVAAWGAKVSWNLPGRSPSSRSMLATAFPLMLASATWMIMGWTDTVILGVLGTTADVGVYAVALKMAPLVTMPLIAMSTLAAPHLAELIAAGRRDQAQVLLNKMSTVVFWTTVPISIVLIGLSGMIVRYFGAEFGRAALPLVLLTLGQTINAIAGPTGYVLQMTGRERLFRNIVGLSALTNIALNLVLIPRFGVVGAAISGMSGVAIWNVAGVWFSWREERLITLPRPSSLLKVRWSLRDA